MFAQLRWVFLPIVEPDFEEFEPWEWFLDCTLLRSNLFMLIRNYFVGYLMGINGLLTVIFELQFDTADKVITIDINYN